MAFEEPEILWAGAPRTWQGKSERLQLERGEYNGRPTIALRLTWQTPEGEWRWSAAKPSSSGKVWASLGVRRNELAALGQALIEAANALEQGAPAGVQTQQQREQRAPRRPSPRARRALDALDAADAWPAPAGGDDEGLPF